MNALLHLSTQQKREGEADLTGVGDANGAREEQSSRQQLPDSLETIH